ncbi:MAG: imidazoleglycerol-phosphate dehydratase HisB [Clostridia bacterium]|nr:imidazoleglycerol-phosphate dehydratase HisB [Clostridia bacterium]
MRVAEINRKTAETDIQLKINLDGRGIADVSSGSPFLDHMLTLFARHGGFDLTLRCAGDMEVDAHHTTEDIGICLGKAFLSALGDRVGITRYADTTLPMDEALILSAVDISGRGYYADEFNIMRERVGEFDTELVSEFFAAFARCAELTLHVRQLAGRNAHHIIEGAFKSVARSLRAAVALDTRFSDSIPSTKGVI